MQSTKYGSGEKTARNLNVVGKICGPTWTNTVASSCKVGQRSPKNSPRGKRKKDSCGKLGGHEQLTEQLSLPVHYPEHCVWGLSFLLIEVIVANTSWT